MGYCWHRKAEKHEFDSAYGSNDSPVLIDSVLNVIRKEVETSDCLQVFRPAILYEEELNPAWAHFWISTIIE
ncbi:hypothetical protein HHK36_003637 [Tetracentron sinense]|uniref:Uncharacterized protein n=1 Tax=Tetracentron sinense TaxID=13715 RepID=A0A834ZTS1_TETSI|nr:hypothetical protein HHK36_003637 [Tetracentron sinense]